MEYTYYCPALGYPEISNSLFRYKDYKTSGTLHEHIDISPEEVKQLRDAYVKDINEAGGITGSRPNFTRAAVDIWAAHSSTQN